MFFGDLCRVAKDKYKASTADLKAIRRKIMRTHSKAFRAQSQAQRDRYARRAQAAAAVKAAACRTEQASVENLVLQLREKAEKEARERKPLLLSSAQWTSEDLQHFEALMASTEYCGNTVLLLRDQACEAPEPLKGTLLQALDAIDVPETIQPEMPTWVKTVATHRSDFQDTAFLFTRDAQQVAYKFVFAVQQPLAVWVSKLTALESHLNLSSTSTGFSPWPIHEFDVDFMANEHASCLCGVQEMDIQVVSGLRYIGDKRLYSAIPAVPLVVFLQQLPCFQKPVREASSSKSSRNAKTEEPWAERLLAKRQRKQVAVTTDEQGTDPTDDEAELSDLAEELLSKPDVTEELANLRALWAESDDQRCSDFQVSVLGGSWTSKHKGVVADAFSGAARGETAISWCRSRGIPRSARYEITAYGEHSASTLARAWCSKMQFLLNRCLKARDDRLLFSEEQKRAWPEPSDFLQAEAELVGNARARQRISQIRALG